MMVALIALRRVDERDPDVPTFSPEQKGEIVLAAPRAI
jgi:hypothetical protein